MYINDKNMNLMKKKAFKKDKRSDCGLFIKTLKPYLNRNVFFSQTVSLFFIFNTPIYVK